MSNIDEQIRAIKAKIQSNQLAQARNEANKESAIIARDEALAELRDKFGLDSPEAVRDKLAELQTELDSQMEKITKTLDDLN